MSALSDQKHIQKLERHYRPCACTSSTPFFSRRQSDKQEAEQSSSHLQTPSGLPYRTRFQHDRDKIIYSPCFRRLRLKSQVFPEQTGDHLRTRLDHTLEVAQIGRHLARQLKLNEDLVDAIALAHDIGHAPFGHSGERAIHAFLMKKGLDGFKHNWQGLRVVTQLDRSYPERKGLDLTNAVLLGILKHTKLRYSVRPWESCSCDMSDYFGSDFDPDERWTDLFEIQLCALADEIGQIVHNLEDAVVSQAASLEEVCKDSASWPLLGVCLDSIQEKLASIPDIPRWWKDIRSEFVFSDHHQTSLLLSRLRSEIIYRLSADVVLGASGRLNEWENDVCSTSDHQTRRKRFDTFVERREAFPKIIRLYKTEAEANKLGEKLTDRIIRSERVSRMDGKADYIIRNILDVYLSHPMQVHDTILEDYQQAKKHGRDDRIRCWEEKDIQALDQDAEFIRAAVDYVAGMTDRFALRECDQLYSAYPRFNL
ncbi:MAG: dNTP triphosphohydrolase [Thaumarchaeota archaeon]|nr:dNTP triphosphohydrolase [Nitrososphaerota archaeon]